MFEILMMIMMAGPATVTTAQIQPCVWPNKCAVEAPVVAQIQTCQWPNRCAVEEPVSL